MRPGRDRAPERHSSWPCYGKAALAFAFLPCTESAVTPHALALAPATLARVDAHRSSRWRHRRRWPWETTAAERRRLADCLVLAALIHLLLVLLIGNAPGGSAQPGHGVGGRLNIELKIYDDPRPQANAPSPRAPTVPPRRPVGGDSRTPGAAPARAPEGRPQPQHTPALSESESPPSLRPRITLPAPQSDEAAAPPPQPAVPLPVPSLPEPRPPAPIEAAPEIGATPAPTPPVETLPPTPSLVTPPSPTRPVQQPPVESTIPAPSEPPTLAQPPEPKAADVPLPAPPVVPSIAPPPVTSVPAAPAVPPSESPAVTTETRPPAATADAPGGAEAVPARVPDIAAAAESPASAPPPLNLQLPRARGGEISGRPAPGLLPLLPRPPERPSKLATEIENAAKPDCRTAYSAMGLLAAAPLAANAATGSGCRW